MAHKLINLAIAITLFLSMKSELAKLNVRLSIAIAHIKVCQNKGEFLLAG